MLSKATILSILLFTTSSTLALPRPQGANITELVERDSQAGGANGRNTIRRDVPVVLDEAELIDVAELVEKRQTAEAKPAPTQPAPIRQSAEVRPAPTRPAKRDLERRQTAEAKPAPTKPAPIRQSAEVRPAPTQPAKRDLERRSLKSVY
ncbi:hypothetical protein IAQ61_003691 [Plenodomus lingam]|uniref:uncharacterized protein n=1 Tax=Leptosphaeria maculans TaxID=5022 RepID=UPI003331DC08|nr:hypothetical protein IAQ61_003691 [Plenodomus lingam]